MNSRRARIRVVVESRKVPSGLTELELRYTSPYGFSLQTKKRAILYDYVLDDGDRRILEEVRDAAANSGVPIEVIDVARAGPFARIGALLRRVFEKPGVVPPHDQIPSLTGLTMIGQMSPHQHS